MQLSQEHKIYYPFSVLIDYIRKKFLLTVLPVCFTLLCPQIFCHCIYSLRKVQSDDLLGDVEVHFIALEEKTVFYKMDRVCRRRMRLANGMVHMEGRVSLANPGDKGMGMSGTKSGRS